MKNIAYIVSGRSSTELLEDNIFTPLEKGELGVNAPVFFFVADGIYHLMKGARSSKTIKTMIARHKSKIIGCEISVKNRKLQNVLIEGVVVGSLKDFYEAAKNVDHVISI